MASVLYVANTNSQAVATGGILSLGQVVHRSCQSQTTLNGNAITIGGTGYFEVNVSATFNVPVAGDVTLQLYKDGVPVVGATATETIITPTTVVSNISFTAEVLKTCCQQCSNLTIVNTGVGATITNLAVRIKRDC